MPSEEIEKVTLEEARAEEKAYNWVKATVLYNKAFKYLLNEKKVEKIIVEKEICDSIFNSTNTFYYALENVENLEEFIELTQNSKEITKEVLNFFKQRGLKPFELVCEAVLYATDAFTKDYFVETKELMIKGINLLIEIIDLLSKENNQKLLIWVLNSGASFALFLIMQSRNLEEIEFFTHKGREMANKAWKLSKNADDLRNSPG